MDSQRTQAIREISPHFEHKLFLTATPHNGYSESFSALLELLDNNRFARTTPLDPAQVRAVMVRRLKSEMKNWDGTNRFSVRRLEHLEVEYGDKEKRVHALLTEYVQLRASAYRDNTEKFATEFVLKLLKKRLFSSPQAFLLTLEKHRESLRPSARAHASRPEQSYLTAVTSRSDEDFNDDEEATEAEQEVIDAAARAFRPISEAENAILDQLENWAKRASATSDTKAERLLTWINATLRDNGKWNNERVIIFTEYRDTQKWLFGLLANRGLTLRKARWNFSTALRMRKTESALKRHSSSIPPRHPCEF
jgi:hypothetical protein